MPGTGLRTERVIAGLAYGRVELCEKHRQGLAVPQVAAEVLDSLRRRRLQKGKKYLPKRRKKKGERATTEKERRDRVKNMGEQGRTNSSKRVSADQPHIRNM